MGEIGEHIMKKYKATRTPHTAAYNRAELLGAYDATVDQLVDAQIDRDRLADELERVKRDRDEWRDADLSAMKAGMAFVKDLEQERRAHAADLTRLNADVAFLKKALARALEHLDGSVMVTDDAPVDRLALDETIDGDMLVRLERPVRK